VYEKCSLSPSVAGGCRVEDVRWSSVVRALHGVCAVLLPVSLHSPISGAEGAYSWLEPKSTLPLTNHTSFAECGGAASIAVISVTCLCAFCG